MTEWVIYKKSRAPGPVSYSGATWDRAGKRHLYKETYTDYREAQIAAQNLSMFNGVGFKVGVAEPTNPVDED